MAKAQRAKCFLLLLLAMRLLSSPAKADEPANSNLVDPVPPPRPKLLVQRAEQDIASGDIKSAARNLREAVSLDPKNARAFLLLGYLAKQQGDNEGGEAKQKPYEEAMADYQTALKLDPQNPEPPFRIGELWRYQNQYEQAAAFYKQALALSPGHAEATARLAEVEKNIEMHRKLHPAPAAAADADDVPAACKDLLKKIAADPAASDPSKAPAVPGFTSRQMLALAEHMKTDSEQFGKMLKQNPPCAEAATRSGCYLAFVAKNPPVSSAEVGVFAAKGTDLLLADQKAGALDKAKFPEAAAEMLLSTLEHSNPSHFLASTLSGEGTPDVYEKELSQCTEKEAFAGVKARLLKIVAKKLDELEASHRKSGTAEEKARDLARRKRYDALK
ncbi:MAG: tetratricopeptide repeat protein [Bdellovibrionota bacterium]